MLRYCCLIAMLFLCSCKSSFYYVVRHAEKETATMSSDVALSAEGKQRAEALKDSLWGKNIQSIYASNYIRTKSTAQPLADARNLRIEIYNPADSSFIPKLKREKTGNVLIVGHSNTVDNLVNQLMGEVIIPADLPETQYGDLFIIKRKGNHYRFQKSHFGK